jgi:type II secretory ATPase GspE/PulE/Tfp pilus assembly ATPase PilB-like protein
LTPPGGTNGGGNNLSRRLGEILVEGRYLSEPDLEAALAFQRENGAKLGDALLRLGLISDDHLAEGLAKQKRLPVISLSDRFPDPTAVRLLSEKFIRTRQVLPVELEGDALVIAMVNPLDVVTLDDVRVMTGHDVSPVVVTASSFNETVDYLFSTRGQLDAVDPDAPEASPVRIAEERREAEDQTIVELVDGILDTALKRRASDIHFEPQLYEMAVRLRVDGVLHSLPSIPNERKGGVTSRLKIMGDMDIADRRLPQDGRATYRSPERTADLRIASLPTVYGENVTIRILDDDGSVVSLMALGMGDSDLRNVRSTLARPNGQLLVTGPTGSGKSTTLYAALEEINSPAVKIYTVEDPVERKMPGIQQSQVKPGIGLTFARVLRSLVRSDPDVIMIGEIRDLETALIATEASLTGHLVLSTLHTNDAAASISRLIEMGIPAYLIAASLECVVAQRLARRLCPKCRDEVTLTGRNMSPAEHELLGGRSVTFSRPVGCRRCYGTGYVGRIGLFEVLRVDKAIRRLILQQATTDEIRDQAVAEGMRLLRQDGRSKVLSHMTSVEEVVRVTT